MGENVARPDPNPLCRRGRLIPWQPEDAPRHNRKAGTPHLCSEVANKVLAETGTEARAVRIANAAVTVGNELIKLVRENLLHLDAICEKLLARDRLHDFSDMITSSATTCRLAQLSAAGLLLLQKG